MGEIFHLLHNILCYIGSCSLIQRRYLHIGDDSDLQHVKLDCYVAALMSCEKYCKCSAVLSLDNLGTP